MKLKYNTLFLTILLIVGCGGPSTITLTIQTPFNPQPDLLFMGEPSGPTQDLTSQMGQPINATVNYPQENPKILALYGSTGSYNLDYALGPAPSPQGPPMPPNVNYQINPSNTHTIPFTFNTSVLTPTSGMVSQSKKDMAITYTPHSIPSWGNIPTTPALASQIMATTNCTNKFTIIDNFDNQKQLRYIGHVGVNVSSGSFISLLVKSFDLPGSREIGLNNYPNYSIGEVHISFQKPGNNTPSAYYPLPSSLINLNLSGELISTIAMPQPSIPFLIGAKPATGAYHLRFILTDASRKHTLISEVSNAFVVWD
jgi:hypothetical protein